MRIMVTRSPSRTRVISGGAEVGFGTGAIREFGGAAAVWLRAVWGEKTGAGLDGELDLAVKGTNLSLMMRTWSLGRFR